MIVLITGASHTGKTVLAQKLLEKYKYPYLPFDWENDFEKEYLDHIRYYCLVMSEFYIKNHFCDIKEYACTIENRLDDDWCTMERVLEDNAQFLALAEKHNANIVFIDDMYEINIDLL